MGEIKYNKHGLPEEAKEKTTQTLDSGLTNSGLTNGNNLFGLKLSEEEANDFAKRLLQKTK